MTQPIRTPKAGAFCLCALLLVFVSVSACRSNRDHVPELRISHVPDANPGGTEKLDYIEGTVKNARPGQYVVLYARADLWWVQPFANRTTTNILPDGSWKNSTHLGTEYAALLVDADYVAPARMPTLPTAGNGVAAVATVSGRFSFTIDQAFWETWWFRTGSVFLAGMIVISAIRLRMRRLSQQLNARFQERLAERTRIAQELHDTLLQSFQGLMLRFQTVDSMLPARPHEAKAMLDDALDRADDALAESREAIQNIRSLPTQHAQLTQALEELLEQVQNEFSRGERKQPTCSMVVEGSEQTLRDNVIEEICRIAREALRNVFQHANASHLEIEVSFRDLELQLSFRDDGPGIESSVLKDGARSGHWGLIGMRERAARLGADLTFWSKPGAGTEIALVIPGHLAYSSSRPNLLRRIQNRMKA
jgi:signal transduction histidine kinase